MNDSRAKPTAMQCWYCGGRLKTDDVIDDGILRSRDAARGGPYRLFNCPRCHRTNRCEKTPRGRWFASPDFRPHLLDYLVGKLLFANAEDFLQAATWYQDNEERRRYFFERDGDRRYSQTRLLGKLWSARSAPDETPRDGGEDAERQGRKQRAREEPPPHEERRRRASGAGVVSPWRILGVDEGSSMEEIHQAFHRLAVQYHPDKVHHLGEEFQRVATEKFKELQRAYDALLRRRSSFRPRPGEKEE